METVLKALSLRLTCTKEPLRQPKFGWQKGPVARRSSISISVAVDSVSDDDRSFHSICTELCPDESVNPRKEEFRITEHHEIAATPSDEIRPGEWKLPDEVEHGTYGRMKARWAKRNISLTGSHCEKLRNHFRA
jgi:hypothetical protein